MKVDTISLNSVRLNTIALNHIGEIRSGGGGSKPSPIPQWIREHVVFYYDVKKQGATNETLKESAYLQDLSGKGRRMKLNNFLFAEMSGVGGYNDNFSNWRTDSNNGAVKIESDSSIVIQSVKIEYRGVLYQDSAKKATLKCNITGITEELKGKLIFRYTDAEGSKNITLENGYFELNSSEYEGLSGWYGFTSKQPIDNCNITITQIPEYPGALVTDGVDDYGLVENLSSGVKMLFMTVNPIGDFNIGKMYYSQRHNPIDITPFYIFTGGTNIAYAGNRDGVTYINGVLNKSITYNELFGVKHTITTVNDNVKPETSKAPSFFWEEGNTKNYCSRLAFYNSIAFDSIPTEADGFTEQELIDYVITNIIGQ
nr:MAG TPA: hypothetical protein [Caudoviricetes sp.]